MSRSPINEAYLLQPRKNRVIVLEDLNFIFDRSELREMARMWKKGKSVMSIAEFFDRDPDEIILALMHLARDDKIKARTGGLRGER